MRRRATLGPVGGRFNRASLSSSSQAKGRLGGGRVSLGVGRRSLAGKVGGAGGGAGASSRRSIGGVGGTRRRSSVASRRSSVYGGISGKGKLKDPRPLKDPSYMRESIRVLITFLADHGYDHQVSTSILHRPSSKDFFDIVTFLFRMVDPRFKFTGRKEDTIPQVFKSLGYPFSISKTALTAVGTPHTWPALLGALTWLVELLTYDEEANEDEDGEDGEGDEAAFDGDDGGFGEDKSRKIFFRYLADAYTHFLAGDDERADQLDMDVQNKFAAREEEVQTSTQEVDSKLASTQATVEKLGSEESSLPALQQKLANLQGDQGKFHAIIAQYENRIGKLQAKQAAKEAERAAAEQELATARADAARLTARVAAQEVSAADVARMNKEKSVTREAIDRVVAAKDESQNEAWEMEMRLSRRKDELNTKIQEYHNNATSLHLMPKSAKYANGVDYEIRLDSAAGEGGRPMLATDLRGTIRDALRDLKAQFQKRGCDARASGFRLQEQVEECDEQRTERLAVVDKLESQHRKLEAALKRERDALKSIEAVKSDELEQLEAEIERTRATQADEATEDAELDTAAVASLKSQVEKEVAAMNSEREQVRASIVAALDNLTSHKEAVQGALSGTRDTLQGLSKAVAEEDVLAC